MCRFLALLCLLLLASARPAAAAEEVFVLENGTVFRGRVVKAGERQLEVKLSGFGRSARVTIDRSRIVNRFTPVTAPEVDQEEKPSFDDWSASARRVGERTARADANEGALLRAPRVEERPGFFLHLGNATADALPKSGLGRGAVVLCFLGLLLGIVVLAGRLTETESLTGGAAVALTLLLGGLLIADVVWRDMLLRNDRAGWIVPLQGLLWISAAMAILRCGLGRVVVLFASVTFVLSTIIFLTGAMVSAW